MYRFIFRTVYTARTSSVSICESRLLPAKCDITTAPVFRFGNGGGAKALSTSSFKLCEKKDDVASSTQDEKTNVDKEGESTETPTLFKQKADDDSKVIKKDEQREEPVVLKTDGGGTTKETDVITGQDVAKPKQKTTDEAKSGKSNLLELLGAMKVKVTTKRKPQNMKEMNYESIPKAKPAAMESTTSMFQKATVEASSQSKSLDPELVSAASAAASTLPNSNQAVSELLKQLRQHEAVSDAQRKGDIKNLGLIIADMKVGRNPNRQKAQPHHQIQFDDDGQGYRHDRDWKKRNLLTGKRLQIFSRPTAEDEVDSTVARPTLWDMEFAHQLSVIPSQASRNRFEEMIQWTKEGKLWQYPIDNEVGREEEASVPFHEHVFLEKHLEEGFPRQGPVRHFMELVLAGLSKNPYLTVEQKKEHIFWFKDYFQQKDDVLKEAEVHMNQT